MTSRRPLLFRSCLPAPAWSKVEVKVMPVAGGVSMLVGEGGNIGLTAGKDGVFLVDDQFAPLLPKIRTAGKSLSDRPIRFVLNTHFRSDRTGSNAALGESGAVILARDMLVGVRNRVKALVAQGKTLEQILAAKPSAPWDATYSTPDLTPDFFVGFVYRSLTEAKGAGSR
jgi:glyoxylase-like metal-dependent hydrolase (beta-lactamase superfamily II)